MKVKGFVITGVVLVIAGGSLMGYAYSRDDFDKNVYSKEDIEKATLNYNSSEVKNFKIDISADQVNFVAEERENIEIINKTLDDYTYTISLEGDTLKIYEDSPENWFIFSNHSKSTAFRMIPLEIRVPLNVVYSYDIKISAGDIKLNNITADALNIDVNAGKLDLSNLQANSIKADLSAGTLTFNSSIVKIIDAEVKAGTLLYKGEIKEKGDFDISAGSININFTDSESNYTVNGTGTGSSIINAERSAGSFTYSFNNK